MLVCTSIQQKSKFIREEHDRRVIEVCSSIIEIKNEGIPSKMNVYFLHRIDVETEIILFIHFVIT